MVLTVEPGLYFQVDDLTVPAQYRGIGVRIEDDVVVTASGMRNLSADIPSEAATSKAGWRRCGNREATGHALDTARGRSLPSLPREEVHFPDAADDARGGHADAWPGRAFRRRGVLSSVSLTDLLSRTIRGERPGPTGDGGLLPGVEARPSSPAASDDSR